MSKSARVDKNHHRDTSDDGKTSYLYKDGSLISPDTCIEVADHHSDGTTTAYKYDGGFLNSLFHGGRGEKK